MCAVVIRAALPSLFFRNDRTDPVLLILFIFSGASATKSGMPPAYTLSNKDNSVASPVEEACPRGRTLGPLVPK